jgi:hypothetical protein
MDSAFVSDGFNSPAQVVRASREKTIEFIPPPRQP